MKSSFVLGYEQPEKKEETSRKKSGGVRKVNPITGEVEGVADLSVLETSKAVEPVSEKFEKSCKVPPGGHSTPLW